MTVEEEDSLNTFGSAGSRLCWRVYVEEKKCLAIAQGRLFKISNSLGALPVSWARNVSFLDKDTHPHSLFVINYLRYLYLYCTPFILNSQTDLQTFHFTFDTRVSFSLLIFRSKDTQVPGARTLLPTLEQSTPHSSTQPHLWLNTISVQM